MHKNNENVIPYNGRQTATH